MIIVLVGLAVLLIAAAIVAVGLLVGHEDRLLSVPLAHHPGILTHGGHRRSHRS